LLLILQKAASSWRPVGWGSVSAVNRSRLPSLSAFIHSQNPLAFGQARLYMTAARFKEKNHGTDENFFNIVKLMA